MRWERSVLALIDDLEQQAAGLHLLERDLEVADRTSAEYAHVGLASRLHALAGRPVRLRLLGGITLRGTVTRTGSDWLLVEDDAERVWIVRHAAVAVLRGASARAVADDALGALRRLPLRAVLRQLAVDDADCLFHLVDGGRFEGRLLRVGADFVDLRLAGDAPTGGYDLVPLAAVAAVQERAG